ncbi:hypothetical protein, conserved [Eimeria tenella]|uniref:SAP domain-containing protein n=1 Tax=Eimeria tenella TaxID=5802 RepID=U6KQ10_EIMTE|nr:hypothetical protein, conserved [Eimeria tenella]CDJ38347.1 hypothetical protein, conserved [Eimeria tenella]|eukprot:XP_013229185.1 hypothetical protein, conserved [Eimeria tenella]
MDLLIAFKAGSHKVGRRSYLSPACRPTQPGPDGLSQTRRRLALDGSPDPYFVVNPHLFGDRQLWPTEGLRKLCSDLGFSTSGSRSELVERLQAFDKNPVGDSLEYVETEFCVEQKESGYLSMLPIPRDNIPEGLVAALATPAPQFSRPALRKQQNKCTCECGTNRLQHKFGEWQELELAERNTREASRTPSSADFAENGSGSGRRLKRRRANSSREKSLASHSPRKRIKFSRFNNVQLITPSKLDYNSEQSNFSDCSSVPRLPTSSDPVQKSDEPSLPSALCLKSRVELGNNSLPKAISVKILHRKRRSRHRRSRKVFETRMQKMQLLTSLSCLCIQKR